MRRGTGAALLGIVVAALALRIPSHNWDQDQHLHPDERYVTRVTIDRVQLPAGLTLAALLDPGQSPLNLHRASLGYSYGALPVYLGKAATVLALAATGDAYFSSYNGTQQTGRVLAGLCDTLTVLLVFLVGRRLWGAAPGLGAAALYALAILPIQIAHFYISEPFMTAAMTACLLFSLQYTQTTRRPALLAAGLCAGLALACKLSAAPVLVLPLAAVLLARTAAGRASEAPPSDGVGRQGRCLTALALAGMGLLLGDPYAVLDAPTYLAQIGEQAAIQSGLAEVPFTLQYVGTWPVLYPWSQLTLLGAGPLIGLAGTLGLAGLVVRAARRRSPALLLLLLGFVVYFASIAALEAKWLRYLLPLVPYLCLLAVGAVLPLAGRWPRPAAWLGAGLLGSAGAGALAFVAIYGRDHTRVQASRWIYEAVPAGARIATEVGDDPMPRRLPGQPAPDTQYHLVSWDMLADLPPAAEAAGLRAQLLATDYLVIGSTRISGRVAHLPWRYPVQGRYYDLLVRGRLGLTPVAQFTSYPTLLGLRFPDAAPWIDTTFTEYDHPPVRVFRRDRLPDAAAWTALFAEAIRQPWRPTRAAP